MARKVNIRDILLQYTNKTKSAEEVNEELKAAGTGLRIDPNKNVLTPEEIANGTAGLLDVGIGYPDKVKIVNGELEYEINQVDENGKPNSIAYVLLQGKTYQVFGKKLVECK